MIRKLIKIMSTLANGNCPRCGAPLTLAGNCSQLCGGA